MSGPLPGEPPALEDSSLAEWTRRVTDNLRQSGLGNALVEISSNRSNFAGLTADRGSQVLYVKLTAGTLTHSPSGISTLAGTDITDSGIYQFLRDDSGATVWWQI